MKNLTKIVSTTLASAMVLASCIQDADIYLNDTTLATEGNTSFVFNVVGDTDTRGVVEDTGVYDDGYDNEYKVTSVQVYLFDATTGMLEGTYDMSTITADAADATSFSSGECEVDPGTYNVYAVANGTSAYTGVTESGFLDYVAVVADSLALQHTVPTTGFVMTNRASENSGVTIVENSDNTIAIDLERVVARIDVIQSLDAYPLTSNGATYATIKLHQYKLVNLPTKYYMYRHVADLTTFTEPASYSLTTNFGDVSDNDGYVIDPFFFQKDSATISTVVANNDYFASPLADVATDVDWTGMESANNSSINYTLENTHYANAQLTGYTTGIVFQAIISPTEILTATGTTVNDDTIYYCNTVFYNSIETLKLKMGGDIQINGVSIDENTSDSELESINIVRLVLENSNYLCYYNYWIKHVDDGDNQNLNPMEFVIVRNNYYKLTVTSIAGMGTGKPDVTTDNKDQTSELLSITGSVDAWVVRDNGNIGL